MKSSYRYTGLVAAPFTPFNDDLSLNTDVIEDYAQMLHANGVGAVFICGTTGEGASMTVVERLAVAEEWRRVAPPGLRIIVHAGHTCLTDARTIASHAASIGVDAVAAMAPYFFRPDSVAGLVGWCSAIASAAPALPFYYYNIPSMTGVDIPVANFLQGVGGEIPNLAGVKYTYENLADYGVCVEHGQGCYDILFGRDELLLEGMVHGAKGAVGSTYNYAAPLYLRLMEAFREGDRQEARRCQDLAIRMIDICNSMGVSHLAASKALMKTIGVDCGPPRQPLAGLNPAGLVALRQSLRDIGFQDFACGVGVRS
ncbi:MAG: dihydrodipicolinate synthase family protein [Verrucomicrobiota bacterium JB024]|nr:dihydrodipicolinate synthase family protein [Verrucomicrobiota bacterium JB024]